MRYQHPVHATVTEEEGVETREEEGVVTREEEEDSRVACGSANEG